MPKAQAASSERRRRKAKKIKSEFKCRARGAVAEANQLYAPVPLDTALGTVGLRPGKTKAVATFRTYCRNRREKAKSAVRFSSPFAPAGVKGVGG